MDLEKETFSKDEVLAMLQEKENAINELNNKLNSYAELEKELQTLKAKEVENQVRLELAKSGLSEDVFDLVFDTDIEKAKSKIEKLKALQKEQERSQAYIPTEHKPDDAYNKAIKNKDIESAIKLKLKNLLK